MSSVTSSVITPAACAALGAKAAENETLLSGPSSMPRPGPRSGPKPWALAVAISVRTTSGRMAVRSMLLVIRSVAIRRPDLQLREEMRGVAQPVRRPRPYQVRSSPSARATRNPSASISRECSSPKG
jgi:hypothetical protein